MTSRLFMCLGVLLLAICLSSCLKSTLNEPHKTDQVHGLHEEASGQFGQSKDSKNTKNLKDEPLIDTQALKENLENLKDDMKETIQTIVQDAPTTPQERKPTTKTDSMKDQYDGLKTNLQGQVETAANIGSQAAKMIPTEALKQKLQNLKENVQEKVQDFTKNPSQSGDAKRSEPADMKETLQNIKANIQEKIATTDVKETLQNLKENIQEKIATTDVKESLQNLKDNLQEQIETVISTAPQAATFLPPIEDAAQNLSSEIGVNTSSPTDKKTQSTVGTEGGLKEKIQDLKETVQEKVENIIQGTPFATDGPVHSGSAAPPLNQHHGHRPADDADKHKSGGDEKDADDETKTGGLKETLQHFKEQLQEQIENIVHHKFSSSSDEVKKEDQKIDEKKAVL